ncbi:MAG TPA: MFS transporter [Candidatus Fermentibacter daniensis]|jgi:MFS family permease|nr:MAG: hypothetical protein AO396_04650 [Candidatus Fermentibacter daniensis]MBP7719808.1 MFS transporter [Candidatus Fermentibacter sp.]KZD17582.1 MAG: hypothetical protein AO394_05140 [Candidatus Fermentibacter daniensis]KZD19205.1 MAG: hypothetical protein AO395_07970 [Candidatus Fermentibacter daniensis]MCC6871714.1 MFS transporter [Candidatus Fermentibacter sp.]
MQSAGKEGGGSELRQTIDISITEGLFSQVFTSLAGPGSVFLTKLAILMGAGPVHFGMLSAAGQVSQLFQPLGVVLTRSLTRRKRAVILLAALGRGITPVFGMLPFLLTGGAPINAFLAAFAASTALQAVSTNAWIGWIGDMVPTRIRGRFFARRNQILMLAGLAVGIVFGIFVDMFDASPGGLAGRITILLGPLGVPAPPGLHRYAHYAYLFLFILAGCLGLFGLTILKRQPERAKEVETEPLLSMMTSPLRDANFRKLALFGLWWMLAIGVGAPFWQPFMISVLGMSVFMIQIYGTLSTVAAMISLRVWGRFIDRWGNRNAMAFAIILGAINPMLWVAAGPGTIWLIFVEAVLSGTMWAGAAVVSTNFVLSIAPPSGRQAYSGLYAAVCGAGMMATMLLSGIYMPQYAMIGEYIFHPMQVLFFLTGVLRLTAIIPLFWVEEPMARPFTAVIRRVMQFASVRVVALAAVLSSGRRRDETCGEAGVDDNRENGGDVHAP